LLHKCEETSQGEFDPKRRNELMSLAEQYEHLADKLIGNGSASRAPAQTQPHGT
jgi:hypothetical protein